MFGVSIEDVASSSCGMKVNLYLSGWQQNTCWWIPVVMEAIELKKEDFRIWLFQKTPEAADRYRLARRTSASVIADAKYCSWDELWEVTEKILVGLNEVQVKSLTTH